jgi:hypothetical protein
MLTIYVLEIKGDGRTLAVDIYTWLPIPVLRNRDMEVSDHISAFVDGTRCMRASLCFSFVL